MITDNKLDKLNSLIENTGPSLAPYTDHNGFDQHDNLRYDMRDLMTSWADNMVELMDMRIMSPEHYRQSAARTAAGPEVFYFPTYDEAAASNYNNEFIIDCVEYLQAAAKLDDWKSRLFYGKQKYRRDDIFDEGRGDMAEFPKFDDYLEGEMSLETIKNPQFVHAILGLATEGSELVEDLLKAMQCTPTPGIDTDNVIREGGDISWYLELLAVAIGSDTQEMRTQNIARMVKRYPGKFSAADAVARADEKPSEVEEFVHSSDCAVHNEPASPNGECDCQSRTAPLRPGEIVVGHTAMALSQTVVIVFGPPGSGKTRFARDLAAFYSATSIIDDWDGKIPLVPGDLALTSVITDLRQLPNMRIQTKTLTILTAIDRALEQAATGQEPFEK